MKLRQDVHLADYSVTPKSLRPRLIVEAPASVLPAPTDLLADFVAEEDLVEASSLPLTSVERTALIAVGLAPSGGSNRGACIAAELSKEFAQAVATARMDPKYDFLNVTLLQPAQVAGFILDWLKTGTRAESVSEQAQLFAKFMNAVKIVLDLTDEEFAVLLGVSRPTLRRWSGGICTVSREAQESLLRRLASVAGVKATAR